jgi:hypothetical protein
MAEDERFEIELELREETRGGLATVASALIGRW